MLPKDTNINFFYNVLLLKFLHKRNIYSYMLTFKIQLNQFHYKQMYNLSCIFINGQNDCTVNQINPQSFHFFCDTCIFIILLQYTQFSFFYVCIYMCILSRSAVRKK